MRALSIELRKEKRTGVIPLMLEQIRTIDKQRLKQHMGMMPENIMARVDKALAISISLNNRPNGKCAN